MLVPFLSLGDPALFLPRIRSCHEYGDHLIIFSAFHRKSKYIAASWRLGPIYSPPPPDLQPGIYVFGECKYVGIVCFRVRPKTRIWWPSWFLNWKIHWWRDHLKIIIGSRQFFPRSYPCVWRRWLDFQLSTDNKNGRHLATTFFVRIPLKTCLVWESISIVRFTGRSKIGLWRPFCFYQF